MIILIVEIPCIKYLIDKKRRLNWKSKNNSIEMMIRKKKEKVLKIINMINEK